MGGVESGCISPLILNPSALDRHDSGQIRTPGLLHPLPPPSVPTVQEAVWLYFISCCHTLQLSACLVVSIKFLFKIQSSI